MKQSLWQWTMKSSNTDNNIDSKFKTIKNKSLGASKEPFLQPGDFVSWKSWCLNLEQEIFEEKSGLLTEIIEDNRLSGTVLVGKIIEFGQSEPAFIPIFSLTKITKEN